MTTKRFSSLSMSITYFSGCLLVAGQQKNLFFFVSALLQDCSLCWDRWNGTWHLHLTWHCLLALGRVLIWVKCWNKPPKGPGILQFELWQRASSTERLMHHTGWDSINRKHSPLGGWTCTFIHFILNFMIGVTSSNSNGGNLNTTFLNQYLYLTNSLNNKACLYTQMI